MQAQRSRSRLDRTSRWALTAGLAVTMVVLAAPAAMAAQIDNPAGPLTRIQITPDLNCDVGYLGDSSPAFFGQTACGTFVAVGGTVFGPADVPFGPVLEPFTPVAQRLTGSGRSVDPYVLTTDVRAGDLVTVHQEDRYVIGEPSYRTDVTVTNLRPEIADVVIYHGADCYLQDSDLGYGAYDPASGAVTCRASDPDQPEQPGDRSGQFVPLAPGSSWLYDNYSSVWDAIASGEALPDRCGDCGLLQDNGMALSWSAAVPAAGSVTRALLTRFSGVGLGSLPSELGVENVAPFAGQLMRTDIAITNTSAVTAVVRDVQITLPPGAAYVDGTTTGAITTDPIVAGDRLTFVGPFEIPVGDVGRIDFGVRAPLTPGAAVIELTGGSALPVPVGPSAVAIDVRPGADPAVELFAAPAEVSTGDTVEWRAEVANRGAIDAAGVAFDLALPAGVTGFAPAASSGWVCDIGGQQLHCENAVLGVGETDQIGLTSTVPPVAAGGLTAQAAVTSSSGDADPGNSTDEATVDVVQPALVVTLGPDGRSTPVGEPFEVSAEVSDAAGPVTGAVVTFTSSMADVPDASPVTGSVPTDAAGRATFSYPRDRGGTDTVVAVATSGSLTGQATITHTWVAPAVLVTISPADATSPVGSDFRTTVTARLADGEPVAGATVSIGVERDGRQIDLGPLTTSASGQAVVSYTHDQAGPETITTVVTLDDGRRGEATTSHTWVGTLPAQGACLELEQPAVSPGGDVRATGVGPPRTEVEIMIDSATVTTVTTDADGRYDVLLSLPTLDVGRHTVEATCGPLISTVDPLDVVDRSSGTGTAAAAATTVVAVLSFFTLMLGSLSRLRPTPVLG